MRQSLLPSLTIHTDNHPAARPQHSPAVTRATVLGSRALWADRLPVPQQHSLYTMVQGGMSTLPYWDSSLKTVLRAPRKFVLSDICIGIPGEVPPGFSLARHKGYLFGELISRTSPSKCSMSLCKYIYMYNPPPSPCSSTLSEKAQKALSLSRDKNCFGHG